MATKKTTTAANDALKPVEAAVAAGKETVEKAMKAGTEAATKNYEKVLAMTQEQVEKASAAAFQGYDDMTALNKETMDAVVQSGNIVAKGYEAIGKELMAFTQISIEANVAATQAIFGAKNIREVIDLQTQYTRESFDKAMAESAKLSEMSVKLAKDAIEPIQSRVNVTVEKMMKPLAA
ncbi:MAG: phasin family protein [Kiloniellales bacterium]|nr:phasin family protein [Kiloniellales bacterium]